MANRSTPTALDVIVAWLKLPDGRFFALERMPDEWHALRAEPLAVALDESIPHRPGEISIRPDFEDGGCWCVDHVSASGDFAVIVGSAFRFDEAVRIARVEANRLGAAFNKGNTPFGGSAA